MKYTIHEEYIYLSNGCDCCEPDRSESYSIICESGQKLGFVDDYQEFHERQFYSREEALEFLLEQRGVEIEYSYEGEDE